MESIQKSAITLSILAAPSKLGLREMTCLNPHEILKNIRERDFKTQEIIDLKYSGGPDKASDLIIEKCFQKKIRIVTLWDDEYPELLKQVHNPPLVIYSSGNLKGLKMLSIVGTRNSDEKSEEITGKISGKAAMCGYTVVSGMALGIDRNAHLGALKSGGATVAVLPGGIDIIYPARNCDIYKMIIESESSSVISEYPPGIGNGQKWTFAKRNRIISGLSEAVIVIQAPLKSGAMITARYAIEQNRDLFVCPGNAFDEKYSGCNELIKQGASIFSDMDDFFPVNNPESEISGSENIFQKESIQPLKEDYPAEIEITGNVELKICEELKSGMINIDKFIRSNNFSAEEVNQAVTMLEIQGYIDRKGNMLNKI